VRANIPLLRIGEETEKERGSYKTLSLNRNYTPGKKTWLQIKKTMSLVSSFPQSLSISAKLDHSYNPLTLLSVP
jgi:hypothetical protein